MVASFTSTRQLCRKHYAELTEKRKLPVDWVLANCQSINLKEASELLGYPSKSSGILLHGSGWQEQFKPDIPWASETGDKNKRPKRPKYRTPKQVEGTSGYDAMLPVHPTDKRYWHDLEALKQRCWQIDGHPHLLITEGMFKAIMSCAHGLPTISLLGVEMGLTSAKDDPQGKRYLVPSLERFAKAGFGFIFAFDADCAENRAVVEAERKLTHQLKKFGVPALSITGLWAVEQGKGMDDFIANQGIEAFREKLCKAFERPVNEDGKQDTQKLPPANKTAEALADLYKEKLAWESEYQLWRHYGAKHDGVWEVETVESVRGLIHAHLRCLPGFPPFNAAYVSSVLKILQSDLEVKEWDEQPGLIPLKDGVLDSRSLQLLPHSPGYRFTWQLPFNWSDSTGGCQPIEDFLTKITGNSAIAEVLLCYLSAIATRRADLQRYLELIGGGGTGKSTFMALAKALAGKDNTVSSQLKLLESNQFETAKFYRKLLVLFPDSERWQGEVSVLKQLTGQDPIRYERKGVQQCKDFVYEGMVILSANEPPESSDRTSGQERRKLTIGLDNRIPEYEGRNLIKEFEPYLPGLLRRVLEISPERVTQLVKHTERHVPTLRDKKWTQMLETNPIAAWIDEALILSDEAKAYVGIDDPEQSGRWLYANFCKHQKESGHRGVLPLKRFSSNLRDLLKNQMKVKIFEGRDRNGAFIKGVGLRCYYDPDGHRYPRPVTGKCDGFTANCGGLVTAETIGSVECDGCDGFLDIKEKNQEKESPPIEISQKVPINSEENPSHPSQPDTASIPAVTDAAPDPSQVEAVSVSPVTDAAPDPTLPFESDADYETYPHLLSKDLRAQRNEAEKIRALLLAAASGDEISAIRSEWSTRCEWVWQRLSSKEKAKITEVSNQQQLSLLDVKPVIEEVSLVPEDKWLNSEELKNMAIALESCESKETLALLRECWPPHALNKACKLLTAEKHEQIKRWVVEQK